MTSGPGDVTGATFTARGAKRCAPPSQRDIRNEWRAVIEPPRLAMLTPWLATTPTGGNIPVITYPGSGTDDLSMAPMRTFLRSRRYRVQGWGLGTNNRPVIESVELCREPLRQLANEAGQRVRLIGWSLGGVIARELARDHPDLVERIVTMATPLYGPRYTIAAGNYSTAALAAIDQAINVRSARPIPVPVLAFHSRNDGIVDWRACVDHENESTTNVEVHSSHAGMGLDPVIWRKITEFFSPKR